MGIEINQIPNTETNAGDFNLPPEFDRENHVAKWVKKGAEVQRAQQREQIQGTNYTADGWAVFKPKNKAGIVIVTTSKAEWVLMFRPRAVQEQVNAIYGNVGKRRIIREKAESTTVAQDTGATGMLSDARLREAGYREGGQDEPIQLNPETITPRVTTPAIDVES